MNNWENQHAQFEPFEIIVFYFHQYCSKVILLDQSGKHLDTSEPFKIHLEICSLVSEILNKQKFERFFKRPAYFWDSLNILEYPHV